MVSSGLRAALGNVAGGRVLGGSSNLALAQAPLECVIHDAVLGMASLAAVGTVVEARYRGKSKYYPGKIRRVNDNGTFDVDYADGDKETSVRAKYIQLDTLEEKRKQVI